MRTSLTTILVWVVMTVAIGVLTSVGLPGFVIGAVFGLSLWVMLFFGSYAAPRKGFVPARAYAATAALAVVLGYVLFRLGGENPAMWAPAIILAGVLVPATAYASSRPAPIERG